VQEIAKSAIVWFLLLLLTVALKAPPAGAQDVRTFTLDTYLKWQQNQDDKPAFKPGDVLTSKDMEKLRPFIIPGFIWPYPCRYPTDELVSAGKEA
jgi:hypothetical protein